MIHNLLYKKIISIIIILLKKILIKALKTIVFEKKKKKTHKSDLKLKKNASTKKVDINFQQTGF